MKKYLITDPSFYTSDPNILPQKLSQVLEHHNPDFICLRDKQTTDYKSLAQTFAGFVKIHATKRAFLHTDFQLASELGFCGVHLPSSRFADIPKALALGLQVICSTHSLQDALHVQALGADFITYSPIFYTPNKGEPKGLEKLKEIHDKINIKCFALGGILKDDQVRACARTGVYGFASIRYFL